MKFPKKITQRDLRVKISTNYAKTKTVTLVELFRKPTNVPTHIGAQGGY